MVRLKELQERTGLSAKRIRDYERLHLLEGVQRSPGNQRVYTEEHVVRLTEIRRMREAQLSLKDIALSLRILHGSGLGLEVQGLRRVREVLAQLKAQLIVALELASSLERRAAQHRPPRPPQIFERDPAWVPFAFVLVLEAFWLVVQVA